MNKFYKIALTSLTTALISVSALAAPHHSGPEPYHQKPAHMQQHKQFSNQKSHPNSQHAQQQRHAPQHLNKWKTQHKLPSIYQNSRYKVNAYQRHNLSKPDRNHAWYKVDGHYLLTNLHTHNIVKVVRS